VNRQEEIIEGSGKINPELTLTSSFTVKERVRLKCGKIYHSNYEIKPEEIFHELHEQSCKISSALIRQCFIPLTRSRGKDVPLL
jgi:hypothetical protein